MYVRSQFSSLFKFFQNISLFSKNFIFILGVGNVLRGCFHTQFHMHRSFSPGGVITS